MKRTIRLNESQLCDIISEAVRRTLREEQDIYSLLWDELVALYKKNPDFTYDEMSEILSKAPRPTPEEQDAFWKEFKIWADKQTAQPEQPPVPPVKRWRKVKPCSI